MPWIELRPDSGKLVGTEDSCDGGEKRCAGCVAPAARSVSSAPPERLGPQPANEWNAPSGSGSTGVNGLNRYGLDVSNPA